MEQGSLLTEALNANNTLNNSLIIDVFVLPHLTASSGSADDSYRTLRYSSRDFQRLAEIAVLLNKYMQNETYPWMMGGDGPVFGIHRSTLSTASPSTLLEIPHLRAICHYGVSVADEWYFIGCVMKYTSILLQDSELSNEQQRDGFYSVVAECWDVDDGQVLLIESADHLPSWVDAIGPQNCRHRCWIQSGKVTLIAPYMSSSEMSTNVKKSNSLHLGEALDALRQRQDKSTLNVISSPEPVQKAIEKRVNQVYVQDRATEAVSKDQWHHRAALAVPRRLARLLRRRSDLVSVLCQAFADWATDNSDSDHGSYDVAKCHKGGSKPSKEATTVSQSALPWDDDWIWTTHSFGKTQYAVLRNMDTVKTSAIKRTICSLNPNVRLELTRMERQCSMQATPHLRHGLQVGMRLVVGLQHILSRQRHKLSSLGREPQHYVSVLSQTEQRVQYWAALVDGVNERKNLPSKWLLDAWHAGPNHAVISLVAILQCPVWETECCVAANTCPDMLVTPLSHPGETVASQIHSMLFASSSSSMLDNSQDNDECCEVPAAHDVDDEAWMYLSDIEEKVKQVASSDEDRNSASETKSNIKHAGDAGKAQRCKEANVDINTVSDDVTQANNLLAGIDTFMKGSSNIEGVDNATGKTREHDKVVINANAFLNLMHMTLEAKTADDMIFPSSSSSATDPYFTTEDYDVHACQDEHDSSDDEDDVDDDGSCIHEQQPDVEMEDVMDAMDRELWQSEAISRQLDGPITTRRSSKEGDTAEGGMAEQVHVLCNMLKSVEAGCGSAGPIHSMLGEVVTRPL